MVIKSGSDDVSDNYTINKQNGTLTVTKEGITKPSASSYCNNLTYNGQSQTLTKDASTGYVFKNNTGTDAGDYEVTASLDGNYKWSDGTTSDITFTCIISKKIVTYKADDASKMYDGTALTKDTASLVDGGLVSGQYAAFTINGSITNVGTTTNKLTKVVITDNGNNDVSDNYNITLQDGTLTIIAATASKPTSSYCNDLTYNGQSQMLTKEAGVGYVFNGNTGITAKEYEIVASLNDNYIWDDKTNNDVIFYCSIAKADITGLTASITGANLIVDDKGNSLIANVSSDITDVTYNYEWYYNENGEVGGNKIDSVSQTITLNDNMLANYIVLRVSASKENYNDAMITVVTNESDNTYALVHKSLTYNVYFDPNGTTIEDSSGTYTSTYNLSCNYIGTTISGECEITTPTIVSETKGYVWGLENSNISINPGEILVLNDDNNGYTYLAMIDLGGAIEDSLVDDYVYGNVTDNYVWYSGKLWRIVGINSDGSIKMVTQYNVSSVSWYTSISTNYSTSHIRSWLNNEFLPTLYDADKLLVDYNWDYTADSSVNTSKPTTTSYVTEKVGLLTTYDFAKTGGTTDSSTSNSFLENGFHWWTMTPEVSGSSIWRVSYNGAAFVCKEGNDFNIKSALGVRPVVNLIPGVKVTGGTGTKNDPFIISGDKKFGQDNDLLNTRLSGEYVKFDNYLYRIVGIEEVNGKQLTKVTSYYTKVQYAFSSSGDTTFSKTTGVGYKLNSWYTGTDLTDAQRAMIATDTDDGVVWYQGPSSGTSWDYAKAKTGTKIAATVGLGRYGELFTGALTNGIYTYDFWTMTRYNISKIWYIHYNGNTRYDMELTEKIYALPSFYFKSDVLISSGSGKSNDPYILKME